LKRKKRRVLSTTGVEDQPGKAASAALTARSTSSFVESGVSAMTSPVAGS
jgi:hypothetical protein